MTIVLVFLPVLILKKALLHCSAFKTHWFYQDSCNSSAIS